ncbi:MAG: DUF484 family protein [Pseudomonadota bacterium]
MKDSDIALYLQNNPQFFDTYADMLADIVIPHPYGGRTTSLSERQMITLREKNKELEKKLHDMVDFARENEALQRKLHQFSLTLFGVNGLMNLQDVIRQNLRSIFAVPHVALHLWKGLPPSAEVLAFADELSLPVCTHHAVHDTLSWFGESAPLLHSFAYLTLREGSRADNPEATPPDLHAEPGATALPREGQSIGLLVLGSEDAQRFYPGMGTTFLQRLAEIASSALRPAL